MHLGTKIEAAEAVAVKSKHAGICAGTTIMTMDGEIPVEHLSVGDRIITRDSGMSVLRSVSSETVKMTPIRIKAGSLGHARPDRDMMVSPNALLYIRDWRAEALFGASAVSVEAERLVDGEYLSLCSSREMQIFTLTFDRQHILYADGVEMLSEAV